MSSRLRLLWWNSFLLRVPRFVPRWPDVGLDPGVEERAERIGRELGGEYDVVALTEAFHLDDRARVRTGLGDGVHEVPALARRGRLTGSGLAVFTGLPVVRSLRRTFHTRGSRLFDSDAHASKGFTMVELGGAAEGVEVVVTHLHAGGWGVGRRSPQHGARVRAEQLRQLVDLVGSAHRDGNRLFVGGDFNVDPDRPRPGEPDVAAVLAELGVVDLWVAHGAGPGWTSPGHRLVDLARPDPADDRFADDGVGHLDRRDELQRIDLVFGPPGLKDVVVRRRGFPAPDLVTSRLRTLSDHVALHLEVGLVA